MWQIQTLSLLMPGKDCIIWCTLFVFAGRGRMDERDSVLASGFIPTEPEEITAQWLFEVINQYREVKELSLLKKPEDILECEINERMTSRGYVSSTYNINIRFKVIAHILPDFEKWSCAHPSNVLAQKETIKSQLVGVVFFHRFWDCIASGFCKKLIIFCSIEDWQTVKIWSVKT